MSSAFIAVASAVHVRRGVAGGFMQVCHGGAAPLRRVRPGDRVTYYSPTQVYGDKRPLRAFTALGLVAEGEMCQVEMAEGFRPWRRPVLWLEAHETPIAPLLDRLAFTAGRRHWGAPLRFGLLEIDEGDMTTIAAAMGLGT